MKNTIRIGVFLLALIISCQPDKDFLNAVSKKLPDPPKNLTFSSVGSNDVDLSWAAPDDSTDLVGYNVYQDDNLLGGATSSSYSVANLVPNSQYFFYVTSKNATNNESESSNTVAVVTTSDVDDESPSIPQNLNAENITSSTVDLNWSASADNVGVTGYKIYQDGTEIDETINTEYTVTNLSADTPYGFTVSAIDSELNESAQSNTANITTLPEPDTEAPTVPQNLMAANITTTSVDISWSASTDNISVTGYKIYQDGEEIDETTNTAYSIEELTPGTTYGYAVSAVDASGNESNQSNVLSITTESLPEKKVLVFTKTAGFDHNTRSAVEAMMQNLASVFNFEVTVDDTGAEFDTIGNLTQYDIIFFSNTSGNHLNQSQRANVESYASQGGNFISNHAASDAYGHSTATTVSGNGKGEWDWYAENVTGCSVRNNPFHTAANFSATVTVQNANTALTNGIAFPWSDNEEWYYWEGGYLNNTFIELLRVSQTGSMSYDAARMTAHYWTRTDGGVSFYTSMGHSEAKYADPEFVQLIENVLGFMLMP